MPFMGFVYPNRKGLANIIVISNLYSTQNTMHGTVIGQDRKWSMAITELSRNFHYIKTRTNYKMGHFGKHFLYAYSSLIYLPPICPQSQTH